MRHFVEIDMHRGLGHKKTAAKWETAPDFGAPPVASSPDLRVDIASCNPGITATVCICGSASNAGKTWLAERILERLSSDGRPTLALKVTRTHVDTCPRENDACGVCDDLATPWSIVSDEHILDAPRKDTGRYMTAGARGVLWLLAQPDQMIGAIQAVLPRVPAGSTLVAEGNSFRDYVRTCDATLMMVSESIAMKPSAIHVMSRVDAFVARREEVAAVTAALGELSNGVRVIPAEEAADWLSDFLASERHAGRDEGRQNSR